MRVFHRYLGFYLAGVMTVYAISGITMVFRNTDAFKKHTEIAKKIAPELSETALGQVLKIKRFAIQKEEGNLLYFNEGIYNKITGEVTYTEKKLPYLLDKMQKLHKATTDSPIYWLNIFFGVSLLFFVVSSFWMFLPHTSVFKKGLYFALAGLIMTLLIVLL